MRAVGLNFADVYSVLGLYPLAGQPPFTPGFEVSGVVDAVGRNSTSFSVGDRVFALTRFGGYCTVLNVVQSQVVRLKEGWTYAEGAAWPCQALTAWYSLCVLGGIRRGDDCRLLTSRHKRVLVHSAAGGVGLMLVKLVRAVGGDVVATVGSAEKVRTLTACGVRPERIFVRGVDDKDAGLEVAVRKRLAAEKEENGSTVEGDEDEGGVDVVVDGAMGNYFREGWRLLNSGGRYIVMGSASLMPSGALGWMHLRNVLTLAWRFVTRPRLDLVAAINENKSVSAFNLGALFWREEVVKRGLGDLEELCGDKRPMVGRVFDFEEAREALQFFQTGKSVGKLVLLVDQDGA